MVAFGAERLHEASAKSSLTRLGAEVAPCRLQIEPHNSTIDPKFDPTQTQLLGAALVLRLGCAWGPKSFGDPRGSDKCPRGPQGAPQI